MDTVAPGIATKLSERLLGWRLRMQQAQATSVYAFLSSACLWPLVQAAQTGQWQDLLTVCSGIGGNLLANHIQQWQNEADGAWKIAQDVPATPELREELDAVLERLDAFTQAELVLPGPERQWFVETLRTELARQGNLERFAHLTFSGNVTFNVYTAQAPDAVQALITYHRELCKTYRHLSLQSIDVGLSDPTNGQQRLELARVYIDLLTTTTRDREEPDTEQQTASLETNDRTPLRALEAALHHRRLVLLGDPGSGKSTFLAHLVLCLSAHHLEPEADWLSHLPGWLAEAADLVPVVVVLRDFARQATTESQNATPELLWSFIARRLTAHDLAEVIEPLHAQLQAGQVLLVLDGLDELPTVQQRSLVREVIEAWAARYDTCRILVTCRTLSYQQPAWQLPEFPVVTLAPFSAEQISRFIDGWYDELSRLRLRAPEESARLADGLHQAIHRPDIARLAPNPLLLTVMTQVHTHRGQLPEARAQLYEEAVTLLLWRWEHQRIRGVQEAPVLQQLMQEAGLSIEVDLRRLLGELAFTAHQHGGTADGETPADIAEWPLQQALARLHPQQSHDWARAVVQAMQLRTGLLVERLPGVYTFPHRTFQEYLAGTYLATQGNFVTQAAQLAAAGAFWREVILLAVGKLVHVQQELDRPRFLVEELCPAAATSTEAAGRQAWLAGEALLEIGAARLRGSPRGPALETRVRRRLRHLVRTSRFTARERCAVGDTLARLGDPRLRENAWSLPAEPLLGFVEIPAGPFLMGSAPEDSLAFSDERPQHQVWLPRFYMARYPVTVAQFQAFVAESRYPDARPEALHDVSTHPVTRVSWYDAQAYCAWLTQRLRAWDDRPEPLATLLRDKGWVVTLPSEAEWEKAARGSDGRLYPWGDAYESERANVEMTVGDTSAVGCFPTGKSPYAIEDMSGNVWEWTRSLQADYPYPAEGAERARRENLQADGSMRRVLRGGAFWSNHRGVRCACRDPGGSRGVDYPVGFRVVLAVHP